jgi:HSP20 family protein
MAILPSIFDRNLSSSPLRSLALMQRQMDRMFDRMWAGAEPSLEISAAALPSYAFSPACNIDETATHYLFSIDVPGVKKEDIKVEMRGQVLTISGERKEEYERKGATQYQSEASYGAFQRSFDLASDVKADQIEAEYDNGVLRLAVPKKEASKAQAIKISEGKGSVFAKLLGHKKEESKTH